MAARKQAPAAGPTKTLVSSPAVPWDPAVLTAATTARLGAEAFKDCIIATPEDAAEIQSLIASLQAAGDAVDAMATRASAAVLAEIGAWASPVLDPLSELLGELEGLLSAYGAKAGGAGAEPVQAAAQPPSPGGRWRVKRFVPGMLVPPYITLDTEAVRAMLADHGDSDETPVAAGVVFERVGESGTP
jgi:hypothetical protein